MYRIKFKDQKVLLKFFSDIRSNSQFKSWKSIADFIGTTRSMIDNYRTGKVLLSEERFKKLLSLSEKDKQKYLLDNILKKDSNWGQILGGINAYKINKNSFDKGREKGAKARGVNGVKYDFDINMALSNQLCEFLGVIIGDGCTNKYGHMYQTQISGDKSQDKNYYFNDLSIICKDLFNITPKITIRPSGMYMNLYSKRLFELLTTRFKIPRGLKCYTVKIPEEILKSEDRFVNATLRGMFNTDGGVGLDKRKIYKKPYIRINYTSTSKELINQIHNLLESYIIPHSIHADRNRKAYRIQINGEANVKLFMKHIGFSNPRHTHKLKYLET